ncbi:hypothetical protein EDB19DRAFT_1714989 [Suillus lakei]|nr:hypothetical protein EDB19DRAFT_1714989 [Suillus lakei]
MAMFVDLLGLILFQLVFYCCTLRSRLSPTYVSHSFFSLLWAAFALSMTSGVDLLYRRELRACCHRREPCARYHRRMPRAHYHCPSTTFISPQPQTACSFVVTTSHEIISSLMLVSLLRALQPTSLSQVICLHDLPYLPGSGIPLLVVP